MHEGLKHAFDTILLPWVVARISQRRLRCFLCARRLLLDIQHIQFGANTRAIWHWPNRELSQTSFKFKKCVCHNQVTPNALPGRRLPSEETKAKNEFVFFSKP